MSVTTGGTLPPHDAPVDIVLLDLDDTLCEWPEPYAELLDQAFERAGVEPYFDEVDVRRAAAQVNARGPLDFRKQSYAVVAESYNRDPEEAIRVAEAFDHPDPADVVQRPGAATVVSALRESHTLGVVTNTPPEAMHQKLNAIGLTDHFAVKVAPGDQHSPKPDPSMFEYVLAELDATRERTVHIGNSRVSDVAGARRAGLRSVWVPTEVDGRNGPDPTWTYAELSKLADPPWF